MRVVLFGGSGMVGQAVLRECLLDDDIAEVISVVRRATGTQSPKLREIVHADFHDFSAIEPQLANIDACFFTLGVTSAGLSEAEYRRVTYDITVAAATSLLRVSPQLTFVFVSGAGSDSTEQSRTMWARVKGAAENAVLRMPFKAVYVFRPAIIEPMHGIRSRTASYRIGYAIVRPVMPLLRRMFPQSITTTEKLGRAMIAVAKGGAGKKVLESRDINEVMRLRMP
ncbi:MAG TPA: NAD(P)H-binding protein [Thermoanaerobaculia bacterium]|nr:NAD(P)H-binding protein [Thermoanaerobaculia bacterium]